jgi:hypothetical protein
MKIIKYTTGEYKPDEFIFPTVHVRYDTVRDESVSIGVIPEFIRRVVLRTAVRRMHTDGKYYLAQVSQWYDLRADEIDKARDSVSFEIDIANLAINRLLTDVYKMLLFPMNVICWTLDIDQTPEDIRFLIMHEGMTFSDAFSALQSRGLILKEHA